MNFTSFYGGGSFEAYEYLGAHVTENGVIFRTYAPNAVKIFVIGEWNNWEETDELIRTVDNKFFECTCPEAKAGMMYKYRIYRYDGRFIDHSDPYGYGMQLRPQNASVIRDLSAYKFTDEKWIKSRGGHDKKPMNIYELHLGSWRKKDKESETGWFTYDEIGEQLASYLSEMGYNYVELMPICEHPSDESWGYQNTGYFSPTSRYGTAEQLMKMIDTLHKNNIGVILDWVPVHFAVDDYAISDYDGTPLYEYGSKDVAFSEWGSCNFDHSKGEVKSFLQSSAKFWLKEFHFDGLRLDAISRIIYWQGNESRGYNQAAIDFLKGLNFRLREMFPDCIIAAEDSTQYPSITKPVNSGGLGFDYKWDMGWMHDTLEFFQKPYEERKSSYNQLSFSMMYFYSDRFLLPLSHDEVVHGKATIMQKMNGEYEKKFPQARAFYMYMYAHPGKKLNFMGNEFGHLREWDEKKELDWFLLKYPIHDAFLHFMRDLNKIYLSNSPFWAKDYENDGFYWTECNRHFDSVFGFMRCDGEKKILTLLNLSDFPQVYSLSGEYELLLSSADERYGGTERLEEKIYTGEITLPPLSAMYLTLIK